MQTAVKILLFLFIAFLSTPTIVSLIERNSDTSVFYSLTEEEQHQKEMKEIKAELKFNNYDLVAIPRTVSSPIISENKLKHDNIAASVFSPPPNV